MDANKDNVYMVTVKVTDDGKLTGTRQMVVTVTNVSEDGTIMLSAIQPKAGIGLMHPSPTLTSSRPEILTQHGKGSNLAVVEDDRHCCWNTSHRSPCSRGQRRQSRLGENRRCQDRHLYAGSGDIDIGYGLAAVATYTDPTGTGKSADKHSENPVIINNDNVGPVFKDDNDEEITEDTRKVEEDAKPNEAENDDATPDINEETQGDVGDRVMATDPNTSDLLTYTLAAPMRACSVSHTTLALPPMFEVARSR